MTSFCSLIHTTDSFVHRSPPVSNLPPSFRSARLSLKQFFCLRRWVCALFTVTPPEDAARWADGGDAVWSAAARLSSANQWFGPSQISDTCQSSSCQTRTRPLPAEGKTIESEQGLKLTSHADCWWEQSTAGHGKDNTHTHLFRGLLCAIVDPPAHARTPASDVPPDLELTCHRVAHDSAGDIRRHLGDSAL